MKTTSWELCLCLMRRPHSRGGSTSGSACSVYCRSPRHETSRQLIMIIETFKLRRLLNAGFLRHSHAQVERSVLMMSSSRLLRFGHLLSCFQTRCWAVNKGIHLMQYAGSRTEVVQFRQEFVEVDGAGHSVYFEKAWFTHTTASTINLVRPTLCNLCILDQSCRAWGDPIPGAGPLSCALVRHIFSTSNRWISSRSTFQNW